MWCVYYCSSLFFVTVLMNVLVSKQGAGNERVIWVVEGLHKRARAW